MSESGLVDKKERGGREGCQIRRAEESGLVTNSEGLGFSPPVAPRGNRAHAAWYLSRNARNILAVSLSPERPPKSLQGLNRRVLLAGVQLHFLKHSKW